LRDLHARGRRPHPHRHAERRRDGDGPAAVPQGRRRGADGDRVARDDRAPDRWGIAPGPAVPARTRRSAGNHAARRGPPTTGAALPFLAMAAPAPPPPNTERSASDAAAQQRVAVLSVIAAVFLVTVKLATGLVTGSLGLIAEAAHSGTDLVAALLTLYAVRIAVRPADDDHNYGHGKAEHLAALAESSFLMLVSAFLAFQAVDRLLSDSPHHVTTTWWAFLVPAGVLAVAASRPIVSSRAARRHHSAALASNALHFASDLGGSLAVLLGLILVAAGEPPADISAGPLAAAVAL